MNALETLQQHQQVCDELYDLALEENRFLRQNQHAPGSDLIDRKRSLYGRLVSALSAIRSIAPLSRRVPNWQNALERVRSRILQVLQLDRENEQLLLRYSLGRREPVSAPAASASMLEKIYGR